MPRLFRDVSVDRYKQHGFEPSFCVRPLSLFPGGVVLGVVVCVRTTRPHTRKREGEGARGLASSTIDVPECSNYALLWRIQVVRLKKERGSRLEIAYTILPIFSDL